MVNHCQAMKRIAGRQEEALLEAQLLQGRDGWINGAFSKGNPQNGGFINNG